MRVCVCVCVYLELSSHFLPIKINLTNISPILIKIVVFKNLAWATSFATRGSHGQGTVKPAITVFSNRSKIIIH